MSQPAWVGRSLRIALLLATGCGASASGQAEHAEAAKPAPEPAAPAAETTPAPAAAAAPLASPSEPPAPEGSAEADALPPSFEAGEIPRPTLLAVLAGGIGRFLQNVQIEADRDGKGHFAGWRIVTIFERRPELKSRSVIRAGDTVINVNGQSIERPEQFKNVWDTLATESEIVLLVARAGKQSQVRYRIVD